MRVFAGIDAGSRAIKTVLLDGDTLQTIGSAVRDQGVRQDDLAEDLLDASLRACGLRRSDVRRTVATGYGRQLLSVADTTITEITCHACGVRHEVPEARVVIDIGGQDSKLIRLGPEGTVRDFVMNDRCAAGTGRFLEVVAGRIDVRLEELGLLARKADAPAAISSMCVVFAETEIIGLLASGERPENIVAGVQTAIATRLATMAGRSLPEPIVFTGGVALVPGMPEALARVLRRPVRVSPRPQYTGALGAALLAAQDYAD